jgi:tRNA (guanine-N7-)-methyltransferase
MDWSSYYPNYVGDPNEKLANGARCLSKEVEVVDIGCGFGGLLIALAPLLPDTLLLGRFFLNG